MEITKRRGWFALLSSVPRPTHNPGVIYVGPLTVGTWLVIARPAHSALLKSASRGTMGTNKTLMEILDFLGDYHSVMP